MPAGRIAGGVRVHVPEIEMRGQVSQLARAVAQICQRGDCHREVLGSRVTFDSIIQFLLFVSNPGNPLPSARIRLVDPFDGEEHRPEFSSPFHGPFRACDEQEPDAVLAQIEVLAQHIITERAIANVPDTEFQQAWLEDAFIIAVGGIGVPEVRVHPDKIHKGVGRPRGFRLSRRFCLCSLSCAAGCKSLPVRAGLFNYKDCRHL